tara:strand:- start:1379 stop:1681 length:303 start_codon:yes stop_codon:yes gene_type:complete
MSYIEQTRKEIIEAYVFLRKNNMTIPSETLEFMKDSSLKALGEALTIPVVSNSLDQTIYVTNSSPNDVYAAFDSENRGSIEAEESGCYTTKIRLYKGERI